MQPLMSEADLDRTLAEAQAVGDFVIIEWMAQWCRKCIYLKPKLEKMAVDYPKAQDAVPSPRRVGCPAMAACSIRFCVVDVNAVPQALVKRCQVTLWRDGKWDAEVIGGHKPWMVLDEIKEMIATSRNRAVVS
eukprot:SM001735S03208  [mRNA]  locus=s1735:684:1934:- [translate_table: standard]